MLKKYRSKSEKIAQPEIKREYHKWRSPFLNREMEMLVFGHSGYPVLFFPTRMARFFDYENWGVIDTLKKRLMAGDFRLYCVDSYDQLSFYNKEIAPPQRISAHTQYEHYILKEIVPLIQQNHGSKTMHVAGCSLGAFHAVNLACRHPKLFDRVIAMSGRYDLTRALPFFDDLLDGYWDEDVYYHMPGQFIPNMKKDEMPPDLDKVEFIFTIGLEDAFLSSNKQVTEALSALGVPCILFLREGEAHKARYWGEMLHVLL